MENLHKCPVCLGVPAKEVYQCLEGHVICDVCISTLTECPQCRDPYGATRVRCRVLEAILDTQKFECKFKDNGCADMCKRDELAIHSTNCPFNTDLTPLCKLLHWTKCEFRLGSCSKTEIIKHFTEVHNCDHLYASDFHVNLGECQEVLTESLTTKQIKNGWSKAILIKIMDWRSGIANLSTSPPSKIISAKRIHRAHLCSLTSSDSSPLFLIHYKSDTLTQNLSIISVQLWEQPEISNNYKLEVSFRDFPSCFTSKTTSGLCSSKPLLMSWTLNVYNPKEAEYMLNTYQISLHIPSLGKSNDRDHSGDVLHGHISLLT